MSAMRLDTMDGTSVAYLIDRSLRLNLEVVVHNLASDHGEIYIDILIDHSEIRILADGYTTDTVRKSHRAGRIESGTPTF